MEMWFKCYLLGYDAHKEVVNIDEETEEIRRMRHVVFVSQLTLFYDAMGVVQQ